MGALTSLTVVQLLDALASAEPLPAGGSASALAAAAGASLLTMAATLPGTARSEEDGGLEAAVARLGLLRRTLIDLVDRDTAAYARLLEAARLPRGTDAQADRRRAAMTAATREATDVPLELMRAARESLALGVLVAARAKRSAVSDVRVGLELLLAGLRGGSSSVSSNLRSLDDPAYARRTDEERQRLERDGEEDAARARAAL